jgi:hypothetical protein
MHAGDGRDADATDDVAVRVLTQLPAEVTAAQFYRLRRSGDPTFELFSSMNARERTTYFSLASLMRSAIFWAIGCASVPVEPAF